MPLLTTDDVFPQSSDTESMTMKTKKRVSHYASSCKGSSVKPHSSDNESDAEKTKTMDDGGKKRAHHASNHKESSNKKSKTETKT